MLAMTYGGNHEPRPDQILNLGLSRAGAGPAPSNILVVRRVIIVGPGGGLFAYSPTAAFGNLIATVGISQGGFDQFGNRFLAGDTSYRQAGPGLFEAAQNFGGAITWYVAASEAGPWSPIGSAQPAGATGTDLQIDATAGKLILASLGGQLTVLGPSGDATGVTDAANISAGLAGGMVLLLPGTFTVNQAITIPDGGTLIGSGLGTIITIPAGSGATQNIIVNAANATNCTIANLLVDGNSANNGGTWQSGIVFTNPNADPHHQVRNVRIQNTTGDGLVVAGRGGGTLVSDVSMRFTNGFGVNTIFDAAFLNVDVGNAGIDGFLIQGGSVRLSNCKSWFSGNKLVSGRGVGATLLTVTPPANAFDGGGIGALSFTLANGWGNGFHWTNISGAAQGPAGFGGACSALSAQDNARAGFYVDGTGGAQQGVTIAAAEADSNNNCGTDLVLVPNGSFAGVDCGGTQCYIEGKSFDRGSNVNSQAAALKVVASSGFIRNRFRLQFFGSLNDGSNMPPLTAGSAATSNDCEFMCQGRSLRTVAASGTVAIDPFLAETFSTTITGAITFSNPALTGTNTTGLFLVPGMSIKLSVTQDGAGGHVVTLGGAYRINGKAFSAVAGATTVIEFVWDSSFWQAI